MTWEDAAKIADKMGIEYLALMESQPRRKTSYLQNYGAAQDIALELRKMASFKCDYPTCFCAIKCDEIHDNVTYVTARIRSPISPSVAKESGEP